MFRRFALSLLAASVLAGVLLAPSIAEARPDGIWCRFDTDYTHIGVPVPSAPEYPLSAPTIRDAVFLCRELGGHPWGVTQG